jgi:dimethylargininase
MFLHWQQHGLVSRSWIDPEPFSGFELLDVPEEEPAAANALLVNDVVIIPASLPQTRSLLERRGFESPASPRNGGAALRQVRTLDVSELQKAEAGVTCTSLIFNDKPSSAGGTAE